MKTFIHTIFLFLSTGLIAQSAYPKLMQYIDGKYLTMVYKDGELHYYDWKMQEIKDVKYEPNKTIARYAYMDSTGNLINADQYERAEPFVDGFAIVQHLELVNDNGFGFVQKGGTGSQFAVIDAKGHYFMPFEPAGMENMSHGYIQVIKKDKQAVYNSTGKLVSECEGCTYMPNYNLQRLVRMPRPYGHDERRIVLMDLNGKVLFSRPGEQLDQLSDNIEVNNEAASRQLQGFVLAINSQENLYAATDKNGKILMDSIGGFFFNYGKATVSKNKVAALVDTNFKEIMPFSYGNEFYRPLYRYPQEWYCTSTNGQYRIVDKQNRQMLPLTSSQEIWYNKKEPYFSFTDPVKGTWLIAFNGDTLLSPEKYELVSDLNPYLNGFFVKCKLANDLMGFLSATGKLLIPCEYKQLAYAGKDLILYFKNNEAGYLDQKGTVQFKVQDCLTLSGLNSGYAICGAKVTRPDQYSPSAQSVYTSGSSYQVQFKLLDSTGKFVSDRSFDWIFAMKKGKAMVIKNNESFLVDDKMNKIVISNAFHLESYFHNGLALLADPKKGTLGLANEKLEVVVPPIYESMDTAEEEGINYSFGLFSERGYESGGLYKNFYPKIKDGKLKVTLKNKELFIPVSEKN